MNGEVQLKRNAMLLYPYIQDGTISHGKAAEILGIHKLDLIVLYGRMGLDYLTEEKIDLKKDIETVRAVWDRQKYGAHCSNKIEMQR